MPIGRNDPSLCGSGRKYKRCCLGKVPQYLGTQGSRADTPGGWRHLILSMCLVIAAGLWAYHNSFMGPFIFDDEIAIVENPYLRHLWPPWRLLASTVRPLTDVSFAINYALGGLDVFGYHVVNLTIHIAAALVLFGIVRRTLLSARLRNRYGQVAQGLALAVALVWLVHPLHTQVVTYIAQRAESLMGLCYLLTLYSIIRAATSPHPSGWYVAAVTWCAVGMGSKPVMVTAPLVVLLYDRIFVSGSFNEAIHKRRGLYGGLAASWGFLALAVFVLGTPQLIEPTAGFLVKGLTPLEYAQTQPGVLLHYLRLAVWPHPLVLDYVWPVARTMHAIVPQTLVVGGLLLATLWALRVRPELGFWGAWFFLILAPSSSLIPIADRMVEHRMYLPLVAVVVLLVLGTQASLRRLLGGQERLRRGLSGLLVLGVVTTLGTLTIQRNQDYRTAVTIWQDTVAKRPHNPRAHVNLGNALVKQGAFDEAMISYTNALRMKRDYEEAHLNLGIALSRQGKFKEAIAYYVEAIRLRPHYAEAHNGLGHALLMEGELAEAIAHFSEAIRLKPEYAEAHSNLGVALAREGKPLEAIAHYAKAVWLKPDSAEAHYNLGVALDERGHLAEAISHYAKALRLQPDYAEAHNNLGVVLAQQGKLAEAVAHFSEAIRLHPAYTDAHRNLERALIMQKGPDEAPGRF